ncbi:Uncharacterised protein [uncultured archaeon]|nr:Uncharacterised protein [uncultured archaeon]
MNSVKSGLLFLIIIGTIMAATIPSEAARETVKTYIGQEVDSLTSITLEYNTNNYIIFIPTDVESRTLSAVINLDTGAPADYNSSIELTKIAYKINSFNSKSVSSSATVNDLNIYFDDVNTKVKKLQTNYASTLSEITAIKDTDLSNIDNNIQNIIGETTNFQDDLQQLKSDWNDFNANPSQEGFSILIQSYNQTLNEVQKLIKVGSQNEADLSKKRNEIISDKNLSIDDKNNINAGLQTLSFEDSLKSLTILSQRMSPVLADYSDEKKINAWASGAVDNYDFIRIKKDLNDLEISFGATISELQQYKNTAYGCGLKQTYDDSLSTALKSLDESSKVLQTPLVSTMRSEYDKLNNEMTTLSLKLDSFKTCSAAQVIQPQPTNNWPLIIGIIVVIIVIYFIYNGLKPKQEEVEQQ